MMILPPNVIEALHRAGIVKIADLARMTDSELLSIKGILVYDDDADYYTVKNTLLRARPTLLTEQG